MDAHIGKHISFHGGQCGAFRLLFPNSKSASVCCVVKLMSTFDRGQGEFGANFSFVLFVLLLVLFEAESASDSD